jgi:hypothetical protein
MERLESTNSIFIPLEFHDIADFNKFLRKKSVFNEMRNMNFAFYISFKISNQMNDNEAYSKFEKYLFNIFLSNERSKIEYIKLLNTFSTHLYQAHYDEKQKENGGFSLKVKDPNLLLIDEKVLFSAFRAFSSVNRKDPIKLPEFYSKYGPVLEGATNYNEITILYNNEIVTFVHKNDVNCQNDVYHPHDVHYDLEEKDPIRRRYCHPITKKRKYGVLYKDSDQISFTSSSLLSFNLKEDYNKKHPLTGTQCQKNPFTRDKPQREYQRFPIFSGMIKNIGMICKI